MSLIASIFYLNCRWKWMKISKNCFSIDFANPFLKYSIYGAPVIQDLKIMKP